MFDFAAAVVGVLLLVLGVVHSRHGPESGLFQQRGDTKRGRLG